MTIAARQLEAGTQTGSFKHCYEALDAHFGHVAKDDIITVTRVFPGTMRADLQQAIERLFAGDTVRLFGVQLDYHFEQLSLSRLMLDGDQAKAIGPVQTEDVDIGDEKPVRCFNNAVLAAPGEDLGQRRHAQSDRGSAGRHLQPPYRDRCAGWPGGSRAAGRPVRGSRSRCSFCPVLPRPGPVAGADQPI